MHSIVFFVSGGIFYVILTFVFKKVFYNGKVDSNNWTVFNLSTFAEISLVVLFLSIGIFEILNLCISKPIWYNWIFPVFWLLYFLIRAFFVFVILKVEKIARDTHNCRERTPLFDESPELIFRLTLIP